MCTRKKKQIKSQERQSKYLFQNQRRHIRLKKCTISTTAKRARLDADLLMYVTGDADSLITIFTHAPLVTSPTTKTHHCHITIYNHAQLVT
jgi:hypothetical protein